MREITFQLQRFAKTTQGTEYADKIDIDGYMVVYAYAGDDSIYNSAPDVTIDAGDGNDIMYASNFSASSINGGNGNDYIDASYAWDATVDGGAGNDTIIGDYYESMIIGGVGNDKISIQGDHQYNTYLYSEGDGNDTIFGFQPNDTIKIASGKFTTTKSGSDFIIKVGNGSILLKNAVASSYSKVVIENSKGQIVTYNDWKYMEGTSGDDVLSNTADSISVNGGAGNDSIYSAGKYNTVICGNGNDTVHYHDNDHSYMDGGDGNDLFHSDSYGGVDYATVLGGSGNDTIKGFFDDSFINGGIGSDVISVAGFDNAVYGGDGDDTIFNHYNSSVYGGAGNDFISLSSDDILVNGGTGDDTIDGRNGFDNIYQYEMGDGDDVILNISRYDTIQITGGSYSTVANGDDIIIKVGDGSITVKDGKNTNFKISGAASGNDVVGTSGDDTIYNTIMGASVNAMDGDDTISNSGYNSTILSGAGNDSIYNHYGEQSKLYGGAGNDTIYNYINDNVTLYGGTGNDYIYNYAGDENYINGGDGKDTIYHESAGSSTIEGGTGKDYILLEDSYGNTINGGADNDTIEINGAENTVIGGTGNDYIIFDINEEYALYRSENVNEEDEMLYYQLAGNFFQYENGDGKDTITGFDSNDTIKIASGKFTTTKSGSDFIINVGNGSILLKNAVPDKYSKVHIINSSGSVAVYNDWSIMSGTSGNDSLKNISDIVTVKGLDGDDTIYNIGHYVYIEGGNGNDSIYTDDDYGNNCVTVDGGKGNDTIDGDYYYSYINGGEGDDYIISPSSYYTQNTINGGNGNDTILNLHEASADGGAGNDYIQLGRYGKYGNDYNESTISGGAGDDTIYGITNNGYGVIYQYKNGDGNDIIYNYNSSDTLQIAGSYSTATSFSDIIISVGNGKITLQGAAGLSRIRIQTIKGGNDMTPSNLINGTASADSIVNSNSNVTISALAGNDTVKNSGDNVSISGGAGNDKISLDADSSKNTIYGGLGNDTIYTSGKGNLIQYAVGDGKDIIVGFSGDDSIQITAGTISKSVKSGSNMIFGVGTGSITIKDGANMKLKVTDNIITPVTIEPIPIYPTTTSYADKVTISVDDSTVYAIGGNDTITNIADNVYIDGGTGNDKISLSSNSKNNTLVGGAGNDTIYTNGNGNLIQYATGDGKDSIVGFGGDDSIQITSGTISKSVKSGNNLLVTVGSGTSNVLTIKDGATMNLQIADNVITSPKIPTLTTSADKVTISVDDSTVYAFAGNDTLTNTANNVYIDGGTGNDTISLGANSENNTLVGGNGNDTIYTNGKGNLIQYTAEDGKDIIEGFGGNDSIQITSGTISKLVKNGNNMVFGIGTGSITVKDGATMNWQIADNVITSLYVPEPITLKSSADKYTNTDAEATIFAVGGNDSVTNSGVSAYIDGGAGADKLINSANEVTLLGGAGKDTILSSGNNVFINGGADADKISLGNNVENNTLLGGAGNDTIYTNGKGNLIQYASGDGKDSIIGFGGDDSIQITSGTISKSVKSGNNIIFGVGSGSITVKDGATMNLKITDNVISSIQWICIPTLTSSADTYCNAENDVTIYAVAGNDTINNTADNCYIDGGKGNDKISLSANSGNNTLVGGNGNDTIYTNGEGNLIQYAAGDGKDTIVGFSGDDSIQITAGTISKSVKSGSNMIFGVGTGSITIKDGANMKLKVNDDLITSSGSNPESITLSSSANKYANYDNKVEIYAVGGNDSITNEGVQVLLDGGAGNDKLINTANEVTLLGGAGKDTILSNGSHVLIDGGADADKVSLGEDAQNTTVIGGKGNDTIYLNDNGNLIQYAEGDGNDAIFNLSEKDSIQITAGSIGSTGVSGSNVILTVGSNKLTLRNIKGEDFYIDEDTNIFTMASRYIPPCPNFNGADHINSTVDNVIIYALTGNDTVINEGLQGYLDGGAGNDRISLSADSRNNTLVGGKGNDTIYTNGKGNLIQYTQGDGKDTIVGFGENDSIQITSGTISKSVKSGSNLLVTVGSGTSNVITIKDGANMNLKVNDGIITYSVPITLTTGADTYFNVENDSTIYAVEGNDIISLNSDSSNNTLIGGKGNDTIYINGNGNLIQYASGDGKDTIVGFSGNDSIQITSGNISKFVKSGNNMVFGIDTGSITIKDGATMNWQIADNVITSLDAPESITLSSSADKYANAEDDATIYAVAGNDTIINTANNVYIDGGAGNDRISLSTDSENNTLLGGKGNDTIYTNGEGNLIQYASGDGKDVIVGFGYDDSIQITSGSVSKTVKSGNDLIFGVGSGSITVKDGATMNLGVANNVMSYIPCTPYIPPLSSGADKYNNTEADATIYAVAGNDTITNTANNCYIDVGAGNDKISLNSEAGNNTLVGGNGNDTIYTNGNGNLIQYAAGNGKDVIVGFSGDDSIQITSGTISNYLWNLDNNSLLVTVGSGTSNVITIKNTKLSNIEIEDGVITFNSSTSELLAEDYWFEENNLIDDELRLDSVANVTENNYSIGENVINTNFETAQSDSLSNVFVYSD